MKTKAVIVIIWPDGRIKETIPCASVDGLATVVDAASYWKEMNPTCNVEVYSLHTTVD